MNNDKTIAMLNGPWVLLFKLCLAVMPIVASVFAGILGYASLIIREHDRDIVKLQARQLAIDVPRAIAVIEQRLSNIEGDISEIRDSTREQKK